MIGARLRLAREAVGLSLRALSVQIDRLVSAQAIGKYERDLMMPGSKVLLALARALQVSPEYLLSQRQIALSGLEFRKAPSAAAKEERAVEARVLEQLERHLSIEEALGLEAAPRRLPLARLDPIEDPEQAQDAAMTLRSKWHLGTDPIPSMTELLEERGIKVIALDLPFSVSGSKTVATLQNGESVPAVIINSSHTGERQRFTLAHELGHLLLDVSPGMKSQAVERAMNRFAGAFLVPADELRRLAGTRRSELSLGELLELKAHFRVSLQCLVVRLGQASILSEAETKRHWQMLKDHGFLDPPYQEPNPLKAEQSHRLHRLAMRAVSEGALSESKASEVLGISARVLNDWLDQGEHANVA
jgi:Zn-dependent peptidase ImmA (M78 family)/transcriptional regulator with XRE-family HTH domain